MYSKYFANSEDQDEMHFIGVCAVCLKIKQHSGPETNHNPEISTCDPLKYTMGSPIYTYQYSKTSVKRQLKNRQNKDLNDKW